MTDRTYLIRGHRPPASGREVWRDGNLIRLAYSITGWPFPKEATFDRSELVFVCGPAEPDESAPSAGPEPAIAEPAVEQEEMF